MTSEKRLIDANALMEEIKKEHDYIMQDPEVSNQIKWREAVCFHRAWDAIQKAPTVDAVEVVRCKDCKRWFGNWYMDGCAEWHGHCHNDDEPVGRWESDFCSYGERKDND